MKRVDNGLLRNYTRVRLYKRDLEQIIERMTLDGKLPEIQSGDYEFSSASELCEYLGEKGAHKLEIRIHSPHTEFVCYGIDGEASLRAYGKGDSTVALFHRVDQILKDRELRKHWRASFWTVIVCASLAPIGVAMLQAHQRAIQVFGICLAVVGVAGAALVFGYKRHTASVFLGVNESDRKTFWQRKRDDIFVAVIAALLGGVLGVAGTLVTQALSK